MTYWADNIKFIKDILDSKYKKVEEAIVDLNEHAGVLEKDSEQKKAREGLHEAARSLEIMDFKEIETLAETMFKDMPENERGKEVERMKAHEEKFNAARQQIVALRNKFNIPAS